MLSINAIVDLRVVTARRLARGAHQNPASKMLIWWHPFLTARSNAKIPSILPEIYLPVLVGVSSDD